MDMVTRPWPQWTEGGLWYFVVGDASPSDVHDLSELLRSARS
jgi:hypothetical protein